MAFPPAPLRGLHRSAMLISGRNCRWVRAHSARREWAEAARKAAEYTATLVIQAGYRVPGTRRPRRRSGLRPLRRRVRAAVLGDASLAHPARQIGRPARRIRPARPGGWIRKRRAEVSTEAPLALVHARALEFGCFTFEVRRG